MHERRPIPSLSTYLLLTAFFCCCLCSESSAQMFERATALRNARIITMSGPVIEKGTILIKGERITAIGPDVKVPLLTKTIDLAGMTVTPGLIDSWSALGRVGAASASNPTSSAWDAFDPYARDDFREALSHGVTTIFAAPGGRVAVAGIGTIVQLVPQKGGSAGAVLEAESSLCLDLGSDRPAVQRLKRYAELRKLFRKALDHRKALEDYEEDLEEYLEKLEERKKKESDEKEAKNGESGKEKSAEKPKPEPKEEGDKPDEEKPDDGVWTKLAFGRGSGVPSKVDSGDDRKNDKKDGKKNGDGKDEEKEDELKKPKQPAPDRKSEVLLRAIDRKLPVRIRAHRSEDILNALDLAEEFRLDICLSGATDAYLLADRLADADVPVVLGGVPRSGLFKDNEYRRHCERNAASLTEAGVRWTIGSGGEESSAARFVALSAQMALAGHSPSTGHLPASNGGGSVAEANGPAWLAAVTTEAARILGLDKRVGRLMPGMQADLVVWTGDPGDPASKVDRVFVGGKLAYRKKGQ